MSRLPLIVDLHRSSVPARLGGILLCWSFLWLGACSDTTPTPDRGLDGGPADTEAMGDVRSERDQTNSTHTDQGRADQGRADLRIVDSAAHDNQTSDAPFRKDAAFDGSGDMAPDTLHDLEGDQFCESRFSARCFGGDVHWYDGCDQREGIRTRCLGQSCLVDQCALAFHCGQGGIEVSMIDAGSGAYDLYLDGSKQETIRCEHEKKDPRIRYCYRGTLSQARPVFQSSLLAEQELVFAGPAPARYAERRVLETTINRSMSTVPDPRTYQFALGSCYQQRQFSCGQSDGVCPQGGCSAGQDSDCKRYSAGGLICGKSNARLAITKALSAYQLDYQGLRMSGVQCSFLHELAYCWSGDFASMHWRLRSKLSFRHAPRLEGAQVHFETNRLLTIQLNLGTQSSPDLRTLSYAPTECTVVP